MNQTWRVAALQMDCRLGATESNTRELVEQIRQAAEQGAKLVVAPECVITGYGFSQRSELAAVAEPVPGPTTACIAEACARWAIHVIFGMLERADDKLFNVAVLVGPQGVVTTYRKIHLPCVGADRFTDPGDAPPAVYDLGGLRVGLGICFDIAFPELTRALTVLGADLVVLPTNWADQALKNATLVARVRAFENHIYFMPVNRVGTESGFHYIGRSSIIDPSGEYVQYADHDRPALLIADLDPTVARHKTIVHCRGEYEINRVNWRRPELYGVLTQPAIPFAGHHCRRQESPPHH